jgi:transposase
MISDGQTDKAIEMIVDLLVSLRDKNNKLELRLYELLKQRYGRKGEGISTQQLSLFLEELTKLDPEAVEPAPGEDELVPVNLPKKKKRKAAAHGRKPLPPGLERVEKIIPVPEKDRICGHCNQEKEVVGYETSEVLEFVPAQLIVQVLKREKLACRPCGNGMTVAPVADKVIEKGLPGAGLLAQVLVDKYKDHLPLYRQRQRYARLGVETPRSTLSDWIACAADLLRPLTDEIRRRVLKSYILQTDSTHLKVLDQKHAKNIKRGSLWCYVGDRHLVYFDYTPDESGAGPQRFLKNRVGFVQADAAKVYDAVFARPGSLSLEVGCWMHARRPWAKALDRGDLRAAYGVDIIKKLYQVEEYGKRERASPDELRELRQEKSKPLIDKLGMWVRDRYSLEPPNSSLLESAMGYLINQWKPLRRYLDDGRLPIDNGECERAIRVVAVGRRNYLFAGSDAGAERAATIYTTLASCGMADVNVWAYTKDVLEKIAGGWPMRRINELLPAEWASAHPEHLMSKDSPAAE